jgi:hypothetical protein
MLRLGYPNLGCNNNVVILYPLISSQEVMADIIDTLANPSINILEADVDEPELPYFIPPSSFFSPLASKEAEDIADRMQAASPLSSSVRRETRFTSCIWTCYK